MLKNLNKLSNFIPIHSSLRSLLNAPRVILPI
ncbi:hypothetical protein JL09_g6485 [Pichia kudriavzevii]|uniref:Uncharacterized protein n=1 Tax=Pichia kudriavzevii TaxID=4909 RepID=A0A099NNL1_PICKU|nr:hypothetical protein JL09_g6485 [Pichia kudriavzevii]